MRERGGTIGRPLKKAKCTIVVYSMDEFISSQLPGRPYSQLGRCYILSAGLAGRRVESAESRSSVDLRLVVIKTWALRDGSESCAPLLVLSRGNTGLQTPDY
jgi:hypothetical protein